MISSNAEAAAQVRSGFEDNRTTDRLRRHVDRRFQPESDPAAGQAFFCADVERWFADALQGVRVEMGHPRVPDSTIPTFVAGHEDRRAIRNILETH